MRVVRLVAAEGRAFEPRAAGERFADGIAQLVRAGGVGTLLGCGGETADAILGALGQGVLTIEGEVLPGVPVSGMLLGGRRLQLVTKSGGFGGEDALVAVVAAAQAREGVVMKDGADQDERATGDAPRAKPGLADRVYHLLYSRISNGDYPANQKLPSEKTLADEFGVSRPILREALERLREQGLIHSRQGAGSFVREVRSVPLGFARVETIADIQRCYEFRICIETMAARLAAARRDEEALDEIATALSLMEGATDSQTHREDADFAFHLAVAKAANNQYFEASMRALREHIYVGMKLHGQSLMTDGAKALKQRLRRAFGDLRGDPGRRRRGGGAADARASRPLARPAVRRRADRPQPRLTTCRGAGLPGHAHCMHIACTFHAPTCCRRSARRRELST